ncbi:unnamed protein product [Rotaria sp. Silwood2]|nr:unnamed protein product [Rotaria sp. Silwood2]CAF4109020.1 unnamed protein product [Rotaria sp. Silwood2]
MSVAAATGAVSTQQHRPTQEQIRLAQLIEDKKHDQPEVQEIIRKVLDVVADCNQEDALVALFDCDYDCEKAVALLIEKGHDVASEWRTATNHKLTKKQQQQKVTATKNGHGDLDENAQQRGNDGFTSRGKSRGGRARLQQNGGDSQNVTNQQNDNYIPQQRQRGTSTYRGRYRGNNRGGYRGIDRNYQHVQDSSIDTSLPSDTNRRSRGGGADAPAVASNQQQQDLWDVGNWNGETLIYSRTTKDDEQPLNSNESTEATNQEKSKPEFDPIEAARQIKNVIGIGQTPKPLVTEQLQKSKTTGQSLNTKVTPPLRIPHQPVVFSDHFDGGINKIDVQFGNLGEAFDETPTAKSSSSTAFYQQPQSISSNKISQRTTEQSSHISPSHRPSEQSVMNQPQPQQQRILPTQIQQQPTMPIKPVVAQQYTVHQQQHPINAPNILLQSLLYHPQQQPDPVTLDTSYDPTTYSLPSMDFNSPYFMAATLNQPQQQAQPRYLVSQPPPLPQQTSSKNAQTPSVSTTTSTTTTKKAPAIPPGMFPTGPPLNPAAYSTTYGVQQQTPGANYSTPYDNEHLFTNTFMQLANTQQAQSPSGTYGSVTPPVQPQNQQQQTNNNNDNKTMNYPPPITENLMLLQQFQQYSLQQSNSQQQTATHSPAPLSYYLSHPPTGPSYSTGMFNIYTSKPFSPISHCYSKSI